MCWDIFIYLLLVFTGSVQVVLGYTRGDFIPERLCATLFSEANFEGDSFDLKDFDQSTNLRRDYRPSLTGWMNTGSVKVEAGCKLALCDDAYFTGNCHLLTSKLEDTSGVISGVRSANCSCSRECKCEDVYIGKDEYARAYLQGGCNSCDAEYLSLYDDVDHNFRIERDAVTAFVVRSGCKLRIYSRELWSGESTVLTSSLFQGFRGTASSYKTSCDAAKFSPRPPSPDKAFPFSTMILPQSKKELYGLLTDNDNLTNHPGLQAALTSADNGRSARNAYVVLIGTYFPSLCGFPQCKLISSGSIGACDVLVNMDYLGISKAHLSIIVVPIGESSSVEVDYRLMATLDEYLSTHRDLKEAIPNAVVLSQDIAEEDFEKEGSRFQRKLQALHSMRHRLLDENYSNVVFQLRNIQKLSDLNRRNLETKIAEFANEITKNWTFPSPTAIVLQSNERHTAIYVNGLRRMQNNEYWPRNHETSLQNLCKKAGDPLGHAILKAYFQLKDIPFRSVDPVVLHALNSNHRKVMQYRAMATSALSQKQVWRTLHLSMSSEDAKLDCGDVVPERICATLFSAGNFEGNSIDLQGSRLFCNSRHPKASCLRKLNPAPRKNPAPK